MLTLCPANDHIRFIKELPIISEISLTLMTWKAKSATMHCEYLYPARVIASPFNHWPATQIFPGRDPRNSSWMTCVLLCPQNLNNLRRTYNSLLIPDPEWSPFVCIRVICSHRHSHELVTNWKGRWEKYSNQARNYLYRFWNINTGSEIIRLSWLFQEFHLYVSTLLPKCIYQFVCNGSGCGADPSDWLIS